MAISELSSNQRLIISNVATVQGHPITSFEHNHRLLYRATHISWHVHGYTQTDKLGPIGLLDANFRANIYQGHMNEQG